MDGGLVETELDKREALDALSSGGGLHHRPDVTTARIEEKAASAALRTL